MMKLDRVLEIFSDKRYFKVEGTKKNPSGKLLKHFEFHSLSRDEKWHYSFYVKETEYGSAATVDLGKWNPLDAKMLCFDICNEEFLLHIIEECRQGIL